MQVCFCAELISRNNCTSSSLSVKQIPVFSGIFDFCFSCRMVNSPPKADEHIDENDLFYFESDHLAVKGNKDYSELIKTLFVLQAQQRRAVIVSIYSFLFCVTTNNDLFK